MFKSKNSKQPKRSKGNGAAMMAQMGLQMPNFDEPGMGGADDEDDGDLEDELDRLANTAGGQKPKRPKANQRGSGQDLQSFHTDVSKLLNDIDRPVKDDELSDVDEDELLAELDEITDDMGTDDRDERIAAKPTASSADTNILSVLEARRQMYVKAVETAKASQDASKARRLDRQLKVIQEMIQSARGGATINESEIPPSLFAGPPPSSQATAVPQAEPARAPSLPRPAAPIQQASNAQPAPSGNNADQAIARLKALAVKASRDGDKAKALEYVAQLKSLQNPASATAPSAAASNGPEETDPDDEPSGASALPLKAPEPRTVMEALQQRHDELVKRQKEAMSSGDASKARRMDRLVKQYQEAIEATRKGRPYDYSELAELPGFAPIPQSKPATSTGATKPAPSPKPARPPPPVQQRAPPTPASVPPPASTAPSGSRKDQELQVLRLKKENFQKLAVDANKQGDVEAARKYLMSYKEIEQMIKATESESATVSNPIVNPPTGGFEVIREDDLTDELASCDRETIYHRLQDDLLRQVQLCARNQQMYAHMEGPNNAKQANEFKLLEQRSAHDLERLKQASQKGQKAPIFHYEKRHMNLIHVNNDLGDNELEVNVVRGINLHVPPGYTDKALETNVIFEFPYPTETPQSARTRHATGAANAEYPEAVHRFTIKRSDTKLSRLMARKELKLSVFHKAGFLRADRLLGVASLKLAALEHSSTIHESVDVYDSERKKKAEGKLEVKVRIKEALGSNKASELTTQRWLVIDRFEDTSVNQRASLAKSPSIAATSRPSISALASLIPSGDSLGLLAISLAGNPRQDDQVEIISRSKEPAATTDPDRNSHQQASSSTGPQSVKVLKHEADSIRDQIEQLEDHLTPDQIQLLRKKQKSLEDQANLILEKLGQGGKEAIKEHTQALQQLVEQYDQEAQKFQKQDDKKKADLFLGKKELVLKEIATLADPSPQPETPTEYIPDEF